VIGTSRHVGHRRRISLSERTSSDTTTTTIGYRMSQKQARHPTLRTRLLRTTVERVDLIGADARIRLAMRAC